MSLWGSIEVGGPDEPWDDSICVECLTDLPDEDPDIDNTGVSPWWDGFCSEECRAKEKRRNDETRHAIDLE